MIDDDDDCTVDEARRSNEDDAAYEWSVEKEILNGKGNRNNQVQ